MREELMQLAEDMRRKSYCPYSHFAVGAALECESGAVFTGCNVENASYGLAICAERTAAVKAVSAGERRFRRIVIAGSSEAFCCPCGACRQFLYEFSPEMEVICLDGKRNARRYLLQDLLPDGFGANVLTTES